MVTAREDDTPCFPLCWTEDPLTIIGFDFDQLTITKKEVVTFLDELSSMNYRKINELDLGNDSKIDEYMRKFII